SSAPCQSVLLNPPCQPEVHQQTSYIQFSPFINPAITTLQHATDTLSGNTPNVAWEESMVRTSILRNWRPSETWAMFFVVLILIAVPARSQSAPGDADTATPIKHVIVIIGENRTFDNIFATYVPQDGTVSNLLSKGIVRADGSPGPNAALATQFQLQT